MELISVLKMTEELMLHAHGINAMDWHSVVPFYNAIHSDRINCNTGYISMAPFPESYYFRDQLLHLPVYSQYDRYYVPNAECNADETSFTIKLQVYWRDDRQKKKNRRRSRAREDKQFGRFVYDSFCDYIN
jgi:hypothetical protein